MKSYTILFLATLSICALSVVMCDDNDDDDNDDNNSDDDSSGDVFEGPDCTGYDYPECDTDEDVSPHLLSVTIIVNGTAEPQPVTIKQEDDLVLAIEFLFPGDLNQLCYGHLFLVKNGEAFCFDAISGLIGENAFPIGVGGICSTEENGEPFTFNVDPSNFLNGEGAPYFLEISNACATRSNRLPLDIVTVAE
ncbi:MAG: hypothetical protein GX444_14815 [Myxococcales bacterium]|nr:hypothetical protein [Myxococcales bacterium]